MPWYCRIREAINTAVPFLVSTQTTNLALLVSAILKKRTLCLSELARSYPVPAERRVGSPKHCLLHRLKRLWRFPANERVDAKEVQLALVSHTILRLGYPRWVALAIRLDHVRHSPALGREDTLPGLAHRHPPQG
jgi:hypothetical protein